MVRYWKDCGTDEIRAMDKSKAIVILPIGAIEQHAHHLPVGTDSIIMEGLLERFYETAKFENNDVLLLPPLYVGKSNEHLDFPGTLSYSLETLTGIIKDLTFSVVNAGFKKILYLNTHGGNYHLLSILAQDMRIAYNIDTFVMDWWYTSFWADLLKEIKTSKSPYGVFHACELETSVVMARQPETVKWDKLEDALPEAMFEGYKYISLTGEVGFGWKAQDVSPTGAIGAPTQATAEKGELFLSFGAKKMAEIVEECLRFHYVKD